MPQSNVRVEDSHYVKPKDLEVRRNQNFGDTQQTTATLDEGPYQIYNKIGGASSNTTKKNQ